MAEGPCYFPLVGNMLGIGRRGKDTEVGLREIPLGVIQRVFGYLEYMRVKKNLKN